MGHNLKVIVAGPRSFYDAATVMAAISSSPFLITEMVVGGAKGVDSVAEELAIQWRVPFKRFPAQWDLYGNSAGPRRNQQMADYADALIAVWDGVSRGTADMISRATIRKLPVYIHRISEAVV